MNEPDISRRARRSDATTLAVLGLHFAVVFSAVYVSAALRPGWNTVFAWLWFGTLSQGTLLALHEAVHKLLFRREVLNETIAHWILGPLFLADFSAFRKRHWAHHRELGLEGDPKYTYRIDISGVRLIGLVISTLSLWQAVRRVLYQSGEASQATAKSTRQALLAIVVVQSSFFASILLTARVFHPQDWITAISAATTAYLVVYVYGLASLGVLMHALRGIIEHRPCRANEPRVNQAALRNFEDGFLLRWAFAPYGFVEHATHHRYASVPYYSLPELTQQRTAEFPELAPVGSHFKVLAEIVART